MKLVSVNVGLPRDVPWLGKTVRTSIWKSPVEGRVHVSKLNLGGDQQSDLSVHGGAEKAVYAYSADHLPAWSAELERRCVPADFGENLTVAGVDESGVRVGDVWAWGDARLQVCQPRLPCYKLGMRLGRSDVLRRMEATGRHGWYLRVLAEGEAPVAGPITLAERGAPGMEVLAVRRAMAGLLPVERLAAVAADAALAVRAREAVGKRLDLLGAVAC